MTFVTIGTDGAKGFMAKLLQEDVFDGFMFKQAQIDNFARFEARSRGECHWGRMRTYIAALVKGGGKPESMKIALQPPIASAVEGLTGEGFAEREPVVNVLFNERGITLTFGGAWRSLSEQRENEGNIKEFVTKLLTNCGVNFSETG